MILKSPTDTRYYIKPRTLAFIENDRDDPNKVYVSISSGAVIKVYIEGVIDYDSEKQHRSWSLTGYPTSLQSNEAYVVYARLRRNEAVAMVFFSTKEFSVTGSVGEGPESEEFYYIPIGSLTATDGTSLRTLTYDSGILTTPDNSYTKGEVNVIVEDFFKRFLSKVEDDSAAGTINFQKGITFGEDGQISLSLDADGNLCLTRKDGSEATFWASGGVSAKGPGLTGGGTGGIVENIYGSDMLGTVFSDADLTKTFNAYTINYINTRVTSLGNTMGILSGKVDNVESKLTGDVAGIESRLGDVEGKVNDFFADANKDGIINKWKELEEVLKGLSESDNLATILSYKIGEVEITGTGNAVTGFSKEGSKLTLKKESTFLTSHQTIYDLIFKVNGTSLLTFDPNGKAGELNLASGEGISVSGSDSTITISTDINALKELFLSKVEDDSAAGVINFQKGITFGDGEMTLALDEEGNLSLTRKDGTQATFWASGGISAKGKGLDGGTGGATTLGGLMNVEDDVDEDTEEDVVLVREADGTHWTKKALKDVIGENATNARITNTQPTADTNYYPTFVSGIAANTNYPLRGNDTVVYRLFEGTASVNGAASLWLGNATASGTAGNAVGYLRLYGSGTGATSIVAKNQTSLYTVYLPSANGTLVYHTTNTAIGSATKPVYVDNTGKVTECTASFLTTDNYTTYLNDTYVKKAGDTMTGRLTVPYLTISDTNASAHIQFSRAGYNYINAPANGIIAIMPNNGGQSSTAGYYFDGSKLYAGTNNSKTLGSSSYRWSNVYSVLGNFAASSAGIITLKRTSSGGAFIDYYYNNQDTNYWRVGANLSGLFSFAYNGVELGLKVNTSGQLVSEKATGTAPFVVSSTTKVANLNVDMLNGYTSSNFVHSFPDRTIAQYNEGSWIKFFTFTHASNDLGGGVVIDFYNSEVGATHAFGRLLINVRGTALRSADIVNWGSAYIPEIRVTSDDGLTFTLWMAAIKSNYHPYMKAVLFNKTSGITSYSWSNTATDTEPGGTNTNYTVVRTGLSAKAATLETARTLWGQSFNGSGNVSGSLTGVGSITPSADLTYNLGASGTSWNTLYTRYIDTNSGYYLRLKAGGKELITLNGDNTVVGINNTSPSYTLHVGGTLGVNSTLTVSGKTTLKSTLAANNGNVVGGSAVALGVSSYAGLRSGDDELPYVQTQTYTSQALTFVSSTDADGVVTEYNTTYYLIPVPPKGTVVYKYGDTERSYTSTSTMWYFILVINDTDGTFVGSTSHPFDKCSYQWYNTGVLGNGNRIVKAETIDTNVHELVIYTWLSSQSLGSRLTNAGTFRAWKKRATHNDYNGNYSVASGLYSVASGSSSVASGPYSVASGYYSVASGYYSVVSGNSSVASGPYSVASGSYSVASGYASVASGYSSVASGSSSVASGPYSVASGSYSVASGSYSVASGYASVASGSYSVASGYASVASHEHAMVFARNGKSGRNFQTVFGHHPVQDTSSALVLGWNNANVFTVSTGGDALFKGGLTVGGKTWWTLNSDATLKMYQLITNSSYGCETVAIQSCFDGKDPETSDYVTNYESRCNLLLQPRGGQVHVGYTPTDLQATYALSVGNKLRLYGADSSAAPEVLFYRDGASSWKIKNEAGNLVIQNNYTTAVQSSYFNVMRFSYNTGNAALKGTLTSSHLYPTANNGAYIGASSIRWANAYLINLNVSGTATIATANITTLKIGDATITWDGNALKVDKTLYSAEGISALGTGVIGGDGSVLSVIDALTSTSTSDALSANQGRVLNNSITSLGLTVNTLSTSVSSLQASTFTGASDNDGFTLTWYTQSGGGRAVTIPTYDAISGSSISDYDGTPCLVSEYLVSDLQDWVTGRGYLTSSGTIANANKLAGSSPTNTAAAYTTNYLTHHYAGGSNAVTNKPTGVDAFGMISMQTAGGYTGQILISANSSVNMYWKTGPSSSLASASWKMLLDDSNTSFTQTLTSGTKIGEIKIGGTTKVIYAPASSGSSSGGSINLTNVSSSIVPSSDRGYILGNSRQRWNDLYVGQATFGDYLGVDGYSSTVEFYNNELFGYDDVGDEVWYIDSYGSASFMSVSDTSDQTKKNILGNTTLTLSQIANAPSVYFTWKNSKNTARQAGTIAQYWKTVLPEVVTGEEGKMGLMYGQTAMLSAITIARETETIKQRVDRLERENSELKAEIEELKNSLTNN